MVMTFQLNNNYIGHFCVWNLFFSWSQMDSTVYLFSEQRRNWLLDGLFICLVNEEEEETDYQVDCLSV
jgi:hypothetical protein